MFFSLRGLLLVCVLGKGITLLLFCFGFLSICVLDKGISTLLFERKSLFGFGKGEGGTA